MFSPERLNLLYQMVRCGFLSREKNSMMGLLWHLLNPLGMSLVIYAVFSNFQLFSDIPNFPFYILIGVINFNYFTQTTSKASEGMLRSRGLVLNTTIPREVIVFRAVCIDSVTYLIEVVMVLALIAFLGPGLTGSAFYYLFVIAGMWILTLGASLLLAGAVVYFTDLTYIWGLFSRMLFFMTPIFYSIDMIEQPWARELITLNPLYGIVSLGRSCLLEGMSLSVDELSAALLGPAILLIVGWLAFQRLKVNIPEGV